MSYLSFDDGLDENYLALGAAVVQQAAIDYRQSLESIFALRTPPKKRSKKLQSRVNRLLNRHAYDEDIALRFAFADAESVERFFYSPQFHFFTGADPDKIMDAMERAAEDWASGKIKRGRQLKVKGETLRTNVRNTSREKDSC